MAATNIPNVQNWTVTPQNGQPGYFTLMNTWLGQSTLVIASLQTAIAAQNTANSEINALAIQTENNAIIATGLANFQGDWSNAVTYSKGQSVESTTGSKIYYTSKVDNNLNHSVADTNYWLYNPINDKLNTDFSLLTDKATPSDTDIFAIRESGGLLKKLSWANLKATLKTYFNTLYMGLTGNQTVAGNKNFTGNLLMTGSSSIIGYGTGAGGTVTQPTNKLTNITLNKPSGKITMNNAALAAGASVAFILGNNTITTTDIISITYEGSYNIDYDITAGNGAGGATIVVRNKSASTLSDSVEFYFTIIKGAIA